MLKKVEKNKADNKLHMLNIQLKNMTLVDKAITFNNHWALHTAVYDDVYEDKDNKWYYIKNGTIHAITILNSFEHNIYNLEYHSLVMYNGECEYKFRYTLDNTMWVYNKTSKFWHIHNN